MICLKWSRAGNGLEFWFCCSSNLQRCCAVQYLQQLGCPINFDGKKTGWTAQWLAQWALQYEYQDNGKVLNLNPKVLAG